MSTPMSSAGPILQLNNLVTEFDTDEGRVRAVDGVSFSLNAGETLGIVGESGCGKSVTAQSIMRLLPQPMGQIVSGEILFQGQDLAALSLEQMRKIRGAKIGMVFQEPMTALNPVHTIGRQLAEVLLLHKKISKQDALRQSVEMLDKVGIPSPDIRMGEFPHQLSGGMHQRVVIAMALACQPQLLIADEPTTALDVTIQAQILELIRDLQRDMGMAVILITHDLGVIAETSKNVVVMYAGKVAEAGTVHEIFDRPSHPYTQGLLASIPRLDTPPKSKLAIIPGMVPGLMDLPKGCRFENRCAHRRDACLVAQPPMEHITQTHRLACYRWREIEASGAAGGAA
jgi:peptide/nickel transport system ATP-binding protein